MPNKGLQFSTKAAIGAEDGPPVQLLSQWRQQKSYKAAVQQPLVGICTPISTAQHAQGLKSVLHSFLQHIQSLYTCQDALQPEVTI